MKYQTKTRVVEAITFDELVEYGRSVTQPNHLVNGMPWAFKYKGRHVTHENDTCYLILGVGTDLRMTPGDMLILGEHGEIWTCMHDTFEATYEPAETAPQSSDAAQSKWQPIATAPRDKPILISAPHEVVCAAEWTEDATIKTAWWYPLGHNWCYPADAFRDLWDGLNTKRGAGWDTNPWVWVVEFECVEPKP